MMLYRSTLGERANRTKADQRSPRAKGTAPGTGQ